MFSPGRSLMLELRISGREECVVSCRVVRGFVCGVGGHGEMRYRGALSFDRGLQVSEWVSKKRVVATRGSTSEPPKCVTSGSSYPPVARALSGAAEKTQRITRVLEGRPDGIGIV